jgi:chitinase
VNQPPTAAITSPTDGATITAGDAIALAGSGTDPEDGALTGASLAWTSSLDGALGTGESVAGVVLSHGSPRDRADRDGQRGRDWGGHRRR